ncbi:MAG: YkvA family protein [Anaerolineales bacterium]
MIVDKLKARARALKKEVYALYLAYRDPRTPWYGRAFGALVVAYALSPIDLIPDPIPVLGYLDDLVLVPLGIVIAIRLIPPQAMDESRAKAEDLMRSGKPVSWIGALLIGITWVLVVFLLIRWGLGLYYD